MPSPGWDAIIQSVPSHERTRPAPADLLPSAPWVESIRHREDRRHDEGAGHRVLHLLGRGRRDARAEQRAADGNRGAGRRAAWSPLSARASALGMAAMMFVVAFGARQRHSAGRRSCSGPSKWCGAAFLLWLAWQDRDRQRAGRTGGGRSRSDSPGAAAFQWINPKSWLVCASAAATFLDRQAGSALGQSAALGLVFLAAHCRAASRGLRLRRGDAARPEISARVPDLQHRDGRAARGVGSPVREVAARRRRAGQTSDAKLPVESASRTASPTKLSPSTVTNSAAPGPKTIHGACRR